jgi:hypothetical protein
MTGFKFLSLAAVAAVLFVATAQKSEAQIGISIGVEPGCPYGYYDYAPYRCSPYGYYGPEWFNGGVFLGAGPWFHGGEGFRGNVNNRYDMQRGYHGRTPQVGERARRSTPAPRNFKGNESRDGRGHATDGRR